MVIDDYFQGQRREGKLRILYSTYQYLKIIDKICIPYFDLIRNP